MKSDVGLPLFRMLTTWSFAFFLILVSYGKHLCSDAFVVSKAPSTNSASPISEGTDSQQSICSGFSPYTGLENHFYKWKNEQLIRYQYRERDSIDATDAVLLFVHGSFANSDHWRRALTSDELRNYTCYALDLWGFGYSTKPAPNSEVAQLCNGETAKFAVGAIPSTIRDVELYSHGCRRSVDVNLLHPWHSPYNFYSWANQIIDFCRDVIGPRQITIVCHSLGTSCALQAMIEAPELFLGMMAISPNFRELHDSEILFPKLSIPALRFFLDWLRGHGEIIFHCLAQPKIVRKILQTPYAVTIDDDLVALLLDPLIKTTGSCAVILDVMSYVRGPLPESQLAELSKCEKRNIPIIWVCYGTEDPWTPAARVKSLKRFASIEKVISVPETGHCPQDEAPDLFHQILLSFLKRLYLTRKATVEKRGALPFLISYFNHQRDTSL